MFANLNDFFDFKIICQKENVKYHIYTINTEETITIVLKSFIKLPEARICDNIKKQGLNLILCTEIPTCTKYLICRLTFAPGTLLAQINHIRHIENIKMYWEKFKSHNPII